MKRLLPLVALLLAGCVFGGGSEPPTRPMGSRPITLDLPTSRETQACYADLAREGVRYSPLPDRDYGGGCQVIGAVQLIDVGVPVEVHVTPTAAGELKLTAGREVWLVIKTHSCHPVSTV